MPIRLDGESQELHSPTMFLLFPFPEVSESGRTLVTERHRNLDAITRDKHY